MPPANGTRLESWKAIADFLKVDTRTARRWEKERGLPVYRVPGGGRRAVYADTDEIEKWLRSDRLRQAASNGPSPLEARDIDGATHERLSDQTSPADNHASGKQLASGSTKWIVTFVAVGALALILLLALRRREQETRIESVSPIYAKAAQTVVIRGRGFGPRPKTIRLDDGGVDTIAGNKETSLVIVNQGQGAHQWIAGRAGAVNMCDIGVRLEEWSDSQIVISGFSGPLGTGCEEKYEIAAGDHLEVQVFGPQNECGPGGVPNCPGEVRNGHIGSFPIHVLSTSSDVTPCRTTAGGEPGRPNESASR
jgi:hypothetical protein